MSFQSILLFIKGAFLLLNVVIEATCRYYAAREIKSKVSRDEFSRVDYVN